MYKKEKKKKHVKSLFGWRIAKIFQLREQEFSSILETAVIVTAAWSGIYQVTLRPLGMEMHEEPSPI